jgi:hypothetical protein
VKWGPPFSKWHPVRRGREGEGKPKGGGPSRSCVTSAAAAAPAPIRGGGGGGGLASGRGGERWRSRELRPASPAPRSTRGSTRSGSPSPTQVRRSRHPLPQHHPLKPAAALMLTVPAWGLCCRWRWPRHGRRRHQLLRRVRALARRSQAGERGAARRLLLTFLLRAGFASGSRWCMDSDASLFVDLRAKVWAIADSKRQGYLGFAEFVTAMQVRPHSKAFSRSVCLWQ